MARVSERISAVITGVKCPGCGGFVTPTLKDADAAPETGETGPGKRWSFVWRPPSGEVCPECGFPLARFARRLKWMWSFRFGVLSLIASFVLLLVRRFGATGEGVTWAIRVLGGFGLLAVLIGIVGLIVGGRHGSEEVST